MCGLAFMVQGVTAGIGMSLAMYGPSLAVIFQHVSKRRTLAMSLVASGTLLGAVIHPLMLNHLFNGCIGFSRDIIASVGFVSVLMLICLLIHAHESTVNTFRRQLYCSGTEILSLSFFVLMTTGYVDLGVGTKCLTILRADPAWGNVMTFFPLFYLQVDSVKHVISVSFAFYSVRQMLFS